MVGKFIHIILRGRGYPAMDRGRVGDLVPEFDAARLIADALDSILEEAYRPMVKIASKPKSKSFGYRPQIALTGASERW